MAETQVNLEVSVKCALDDDVLLFHELHGTEQVGGLFEFRVTLRSTHPDIAVADILGKGMTVSIVLHNQTHRHLNGIVTRFSNNGWHEGFCSYEATVAPALWLLTQSWNCRLFQNLTVLDIIKSVITTQCYSGLIELDAKLVDTVWAPREYCVQYRESDFNFVCRLLEEEGVYYYFRHDAHGHGHAMVLADSFGAHEKAPGCDTLRFWSDDSTLAHHEVVVEWHPSGRVETNVVVLNDFNYLKPSEPLLVKAKLDKETIENSLEQYDYPGLHQSNDLGAKHVRARMEALRGNSDQVTARTNARGLTPGALFRLEHHPLKDQNREFLVTSARYDIVGPDYRSGGAVTESMSFTCHFTCVGTAQSYRAPRVTAKPFVHGPQTARVVGPAGDEVYTDEHGRVKLQFHWDRGSTGDETSSCWVRVSQTWASAGWGAVFIPRIGMEVVVSFLEGDPDRPLVTGCVYNGQARPTFGGSDSKTRSSIRSNSSKGGGGYNEIAFEDRKGQEEFFVQAEKNYTRVVKNNDSLKVGFEKKESGDQVIGIFNDQTVDIGHDQSIGIKNNQVVKIDGDQTVTIGKTCVIEATTSIELNVGSSSIKIEPARITIKSSAIEVEADAIMNIKAGGAITIAGGIVKIN